VAGRDGERGEGEGGGVELRVGGVVDVNVNVDFVFV